jgi:hypothetical protein
MMGGVGGGAAALGGGEAGFRWVATAALRASLTGQKATATDVSYPPVTGPGRGASWASLPWRRSVPAGLRGLPAGRCALRLRANRCALQQHSWRTTRCDATCDKLWAAATAQPCAAAVLCWGCTCTRSRVPGLPGCAPPLCGLRCADTSAAGRTCSIRGSAGSGCACAGPGQGPHGAVGGGAAHGSRGPGPAGGSSFPGRRRGALFEAGASAGTEAGGHQAGQARAEPFPRKGR